MACRAKIVYSTGRKYLLVVDTASSDKIWQVLPKFRQAPRYCVWHLSVEMKRIIDTSEVLGIVETTDGMREVCATADANYDESAARLVVKLDAFLRNTDLLSKEKLSSADWLPKPETIREAVGPEETVDMARDIFHRWVHKVRQVVPGLASR